LAWGTPSNPVLKNWLAFSSWTWPEASALIFKYQAERRQARVEERKGEKLPLKNEAVKIRTRRKDHNILKVSQTCTVLELAESNSKCSTNNY